MTTESMPPAAAKPCPGSCNRRWRAAQALADQRAREVVSRLRPLRRADIDVIVHDEPLTVGDPVWCSWCSGAIADAIWRTIELTFALWAVGHEDDSPRLAMVVERVPQYGYATRPDAVTARALRGAPLPPREVIGYVDRLSCSHSVRTIGSSPQPKVTKCWQCSIDAPRSTGQLVPPTGASPAAGRGRVKGSPALSPSLLAVDELVAWVTSTEDYLREQLDDPRPPRRVVDAVGRRLLTTDELLAVGNSRAIASNEAMSAAVRYLADHHDELLATPRAEELGLEILRLERMAGKRSDSEDLPVRLSIPCPACDRRALWARPSDEWAKCRRCGAVEAMDHIHLVAAIHGA